MNSKHAFLALSVFTLVSIAHGEREVFAPTKLAPVATAANGNITFSNTSPFWTGANISATTSFGIGTNTASVFTLHTNGAERMRINSAGNVFVGNGETAASVANGNIRATGGSGTNINGADLVLHGGQSTGTASGGALRFFTAPAGGVSGTSVNASTERMRITSAGNVGIGTTNPTALNSGKVVEVKNDSNAGTAADNMDLVVESVNRFATLGLISSNSHAAELRFGAQTNKNRGGLIYDSSNDSLAFRNNSLERMRITSGGEIVAGNGDTNASPAAATIRGTNGSGTNISAANLTIAPGRGTGTGAGGAVVFQTSAAGTTGSTLNAATERMRIKSNGAVRFVPQGTPATAEEGDVYFDSGTKKLRVYDGTNWVDLH